MTSPALRRLPGWLAFGLVAATALTSQAAESIFPDPVLPTGRQTATSPKWELGTVFRPTVAGKVTDARVFAMAQEFGDHEVRLWRNADNALIAGPITWTFGGEETWITLDIPDVSLEANQDYTISIAVADDGLYPSIGGYFGSPGNNGQNLDYPQGAGVLSDVPGARPTVVSVNAAYLRDIVFEPELAGTLMLVRGNGNTIADGATSPDLANGTDVGGRSLDQGFREQTYTILNQGQTSLDLSGNPRVALSGTAAGNFNVTVQPQASVEPGGSTTFTIRFDPSALGIRPATVTIPRAGNAANPYDFAIQGTGLGGGAGVLGNDGEGAFARNIDANAIHGNRFSAPVNMRISAIQAKVLELAGTFKCAVYSDAGGVADRLLAASVEVLNPTNGWNRFALSAPLDLVGGDGYWLVVWSDTPGARVQADIYGVGYEGVYSYVDLGGAWPDPITLTPLLGDAATRTYCLYAEGAAIGVGPGAEFDLRGNGKLIVTGDRSPSDLDGTDFGSRNLGGDFREQTFTIENRGDAPLSLTGNPTISITGTNAGDWTVSAAPVSSIPPAGSTTFTLRFSPLASGLREALVSIANNDPDESPYQFAVQGAGLTTGRESIFADTKAGRDIDFDGAYYELGTVFRAAVPGAVSQLRVYSLASESGDHTARIWRNDDETVIGGPYTWNYGGSTGWITLDIPDVDIEPGVDYTVSVSVGTSAKRNYPNLAADLLTAGGNGQNLTYPANAGVFTETRDARPTGSFNGGNYLRDIVFVPAGPETIFPDTKAGRDIDFDGAYYELGTVFQTSVAGSITHLRVYSLSSESGDHTARLWRNDDESIVGGPYTWNYGGTTGWITLDIPDVPVEPGVDYTVAVSTGTSAKRNYPNIAADLLTAGGNGQHLSYPVNAGVFTETRDARPTGSFNGGNYLRDVVFLRAGAVAPTPPPRIVEVTPDTAAGNLTLRWEGAGPQFQVEKASTVNGPFQPVGAAQAERTFTDPGVLRANIQNYYRVRQF